MRIYITEEYKICKMCGRKYTYDDLHDIWVMQGYNPICQPAWVPSRKYCGPWCREFRNHKLKAIVTGYGRYTRKDFYNYVKKYGNQMVTLSDVTYL